MKLDPLNPTFLTGRDSIVAAAHASGAPQEDIADIWAGFSARGMGPEARILNAVTPSIVESFDLPGIRPSPSRVITDSIPTAGWILARAWVSHCA